MALRLVFNPVSGQFDFVNAGGGGGSGTPVVVADGESFEIAENTQVLYREPIRLGAGSEIVGNAESHLIGV